MKSHLIQHNAIVHFPFHKRNTEKIIQNSSIDNNGKNEKLFHEKNSIVTSDIPDFDSSKMSYNENRLSTESDFSSVHEGRKLFFV